MIPLPEKKRTTSNGLPLLVGESSQQTIESPQKKETTSNGLPMFGNDPAFKKKVGGENYGTGSPTESVVESVSVSTEPMSPTSFLKNDIEKSLIFSTPEIPEFDPRSLAQPTTPDDTKGQDQISKIKDKETILGDTNELSKYIGKRFTQVESEIKSLEDIKAKELYNRKFAGLDNGASSTYNDTQAQINEKKQYLNKLRQGAAAQAASIILPKYLKDPENFNPEMLGRDLVKASSPDLEAKFNLVEGSGKVLPGIQRGDMEKTGIDLMKSYLDGYKLPPQEEIDAANTELAAMDMELSKNQDSPALRTKAEALRSKLSGINDLKKMRDRVSVYEKDFDEKNYELTWSTAKDKLGAFFHGKGDSGVFGYSPEKLKEAVNDPDSGLTEGERNVALNYGIPLESKLIGTDIPGSGLVRSFKNAVEQSVGNTWNTIASESNKRLGINLGRTESDQAFDLLNSENAGSRFRNVGDNPRASAELTSLKNKESSGGKLTKIESDRKVELQKYVDVRTNWDKVKDLTGNMTGQVAAIALVAKGVGGVGELLTSASTALGTTATGVTTGAIGTALSNEFGGLFVSSYLFAKDGYDQQAIELMPKPEQAAERDAYSGLMSGFEAATELIFRDTKVLDAFMGGLSPTVAGVAKKYINGDMTRDAARAEINSFITKYVKTAGKEFVTSVGENATEESVMDILQGVTNAGFGVDDWDLYKTGTKAVDTFVTTAISSGIIGSMAGHGAYRKANNQSRFMKATVADMAVNPAKYLRSVEELQSAGEISQQQANDKIKIIKSSSKFLGELPATREVPVVDNDGNEVVVSKKFDYPEATSYVLHRLNEGILTEKLDATTDPIEQSVLKKQISQSEKIRKGIYEGKIGVTPNIDPVSNNPEEAQELGILNAEETDASDLIGTPFKKETTTEAGVPEVSVNEKEQAAIEGLQNKDFDNSPIKPYTDVIQNPDASIEDKKEALKGLSDQLTAKGTEITVGEALGKEADLIYDLGYEPAQESEAIRAVTGDGTSTTPLLDKFKERKRIEAQQFDESAAEKGVAIVRPSAVSTPNVVEKASTSQQPSDQKSKISVITPSQNKSPELVSETSPEVIEVSQIIDKELVPSGVEGKSAIRDFFKKEMNEDYDEELVDAAYDLYKRRVGEISPEPVTEEAPVAEEAVIELTPKEKLASDKSFISYKAKYPKATQGEYQENRVSGTLKKDRIKKAENKPTISKPATNATEQPIVDSNSEVEAKKADIERRRKEELKSSTRTDIGNLKTIQTFKKANVKSTIKSFPVNTLFVTTIEGRDRGDDYIAWKKDSFVKISENEIKSLDNGEIYSLNDSTAFVKNRDIEIKEGLFKDSTEINAKYDAKLDALKNKPTISKEPAIAKEEPKKKAPSKKKITNIEDAEEELKRIMGIIAQSIAYEKIYTGQDINHLGASATHSINNTAEDLLKNAKEYFLSEGEDIMVKAADFVEPLLKLAKGIKFDKEGSLNPEIHGQFNTKKNTIYVNPNSATSAEEYNYVALHELVHAVTIGALDRDIILSTRLSQIVDDLRDKFGLPSSENAIMNGIKNGTIDRAYYGLSNNRELIAELFTNKDFYEKLKNTKYEGSTVVSYLVYKLLDAFEKLTGIHLNRKDTAEALLHIIDSKFNNAKTIKAPVAFISAKAIKGNEQEQAIRDLIDRSENLDAEELKKLIKKYTGWTDEKVGGFFDKETGITHAQTKETAKEFGFKEYEKDTPQTLDEWDNEAEKLIKGGYNIGDLVGRIENGHLPTKVEQRIMGFYMATLEAEVENNPSDENIAKLVRAVKASDVGGGRELARSFVARRGSKLRDNSLASFFMEESETNNDAPLTDQQKETTRKEYAEIKAAQLAYENKVLELEKENARLRAEKTIKKDAATTKKTKKTHEDYVTERKEIFSSIREKLKQARTGESGLTAVPVPYAKELFAIAPDVMKLTRSLLEEGVTKLGDIVSEIHTNIKDHIAGVTEKDIHDIIAGEYNAPKPTRSEINRQVYELRKEAKAINALEKENAKEPKTEKEKRQKIQEVEKLKKEIKDPDEKKLAATKKRIQEQIDDLERRLKEGDFSTPEKKEPLKLDKEAIALKDKLLALKQERDIRLMQQKYENRSRHKKAVDRALEVANVPRTIMSSMDFSAPLRQAVIPTVAHPTLAAKAGIEMFKQAFSQKRFDRWFSDLKEDPRYDIMGKSGLYVADPHDPRLSAKEEAFMNNLAEKIPIIGPLIKGSERAYVGYLNKMRVDLFNRMADAFEESGITFENSPETYTSLASWVNNSTGRGGVGPFEGAAPVLNSVFFSPRLIASRFNILGLSDLAGVATGNKGLYSKMPKAVRVEALKDLAKFVGTGMTLLSVLALAAGGDDEDDIQIGTDPRSTDFGKIKKGNTRWDIWGGFQQYARLIAQVFSGKKVSAASGRVSELDGKGSFGENRMDVLGRFVRGKLAPVPSMVADALTGRTIGGEKVTVKEEIKSHFAPLLYGDLKEAVADKGVQALFSVGVPSIFGVGVQTYNPRGYDNVNKKEGVYKTLYEKDLNLSIPDQKEMTDKQYKEFVPKRQQIFKSEWETVVKHGAMLNKDGNPTIDKNDGIAKKPFDKLTHDELTSLMKSISGRATRQAEKAIDYEAPKEKKNEEYIKKKK